MHGPRHKAGVTENYWDNAVGDLRPALQRMNTREI